MPFSGFYPCQKPTRWENFDCVNEPSDTPVPQQQANNPLHGIKLELIVTDLVDKYGWEELAERIRIRCFQFDPSVKSSLKFLRRTPWAREKVEQLYLDSFNQSNP
nr:VF530 family protein [Oceanipulchritudo coccoides]